MTSGHDNLGEGESVVPVSQRVRKNFLSSFSKPFRPSHWSKLSHVAILKQIAITKGMLHVDWPRLELLSQSLGRVMRLHMIGLNQQFSDFCSQDSCGILSKN